MSTPTSTSNTHEMAFEIEQHSIIENTVAEILASKHTTNILCMATQSAYLLLQYLPHIIH